jgi:outer membrane protein insertion porin family
MNPYFTDEGLSLGYNLWRESSTIPASTWPVLTNSGRAGLLAPERIGFVSLMFGIDTNEIQHSQFHATAAGGLYHAVKPHLQV